MHWLCRGSGQVLIGQNTNVSKQPHVLHIEQDEQESASDLKNNGKGLLYLHNAEWHVNPQDDPMQNQKPWGKVFIAFTWYPLDPLLSFYTHKQTKPKWTIKTTLPCCVTLLKQMDISDDLTCFFTLHNAGLGVDFDWWSDRYKSYWFNPVRNTHPPIWRTTRGDGEKLTLNTPPLWHMGSDVTTGGLSTTATYFAAQKISVRSWKKVLTNTISTP